MRHIASCSFGKDSTAMVLKLIEEGRPLDEVVFYDMGMEFQAVYAVRDRLIPTIREYGAKYTELHPERPFIYDMLARPKYKRDGSFALGDGWCGGPCRWGTGIKRKAMDKYAAGAHVYVGIAVDEPSRLENLAKNKSAPLAEWDMTEADCLAYCRERGISWTEGGVDLYDVLDRVSCWCCRNKNLKELRAVWKHLPGYWEKLKALQGRLPEMPMKDYHNRERGDYGSIPELEKLFMEEEKNGNEKD